MGYAAGRLAGRVASERGENAKLVGGRVLDVPPELHLLGRLGASMTVMESYVEHPPLPGLAGVVRTVWVQRTGDVAYVQRHLPTGGVEIRFPIGGHPQLAGPLTGPEIEVIPAHTTILGVKNAYDPHRFFDFPQAI